MITNTAKEDNGEAEDFRKMLLTQAKVIESLRENKNTNNVNKDKGKENREDSKLWKALGHR